ncbi:D-alanyl-D-alanine carboxypeptidase/D-alanyl-D-alanine-endopeptidase [Virgibacillus xinjiangensis]|uniref:D-alanyl-D-alanine carboxypeptidase/D-alanyl-D-alanine-endopeptidase n=1 Tax=Virgibacillus xinjiangensis TaxID=393090 RepID=A0ABV7CXU7_9BACI
MTFKRAVIFSFVAILILSLPWVVQEKQLFVNASEENTEALEGNGTLEEKLAAILDDEQLDGSVTGVSVRDADTGDLLFSRNGDTHLHPASNMKLLSGAAAMEVLGEDYQFMTEVWTDGKINGQVLHGDIYLKGKGDPTLRKEDLDILAKELKNHGIKKIKGDLVGDDTWYDDVRLSLDLNWSDESYYTGAQVSALTLSPDKDYDAGTVIVEVKPSDKIGEEANVQITPETDYITVVNNTEMVNKGAEKNISIEREHGTNNLIIEGEMPLDGSDSKVWRSVWEPTGYAVDVFKKSLEEQGIDFIGQTDIRYGKTPKSASRLANKESIPLEDLFLRFMKLSNNGHGETLTKEMGRVVHEEGSWDKGIEVIEKVVTGLGVDEEAILLRDGSGMSHKNYIPANELTQLLYAIQGKEWFEAFQFTLPVAGDSDRFEGGTLRYRMRDEPAEGKVKAKTGSLTSVSALSGYVTTKDGEKLVFSVLINNYLGSKASEIEDAIANTLADHELEE